MKKTALIFLFFSVTQYLYGNSCNDLITSLPERYRKEVEAATQVAREDLYKAVSAIEAIKVQVEQRQDLQTNEKYSILILLEKSIGVIYEDNNQLDKAKEHYIKELNYIELCDNKEAKMGVFIDLAIVEKRKGNFKEAKLNYMRCLELAEAQSNNKLQDFAHYGLGTLYEASGEYEQAVQSYIKSLKLAEARGSKSDAVNTMQNLAITYTKLNNNQLALETIQKAHNEVPYLKDSTLMASIIFDYGKVLNVIGNRDEAILKFQQSLDLFRQLNFRPLIARSLFYLADVHTQKGDFAKAEQLFLECADYEQFVSKRSFTELHNKLGDLSLMKNNIEQAQGHFFQAFETAKSCDYKELLKESSQKLATTFERTGDFQNAFVYLNIASNIKDTIYNDRQSKAIAEMQVKYDSEKNSHEIETLKFKQTRLLLIFGGILSLATIAFAFYLIRIRGKSNMDLRIKNNQINMQNKQLTEKNIALEQFAYAAAHDLKEPLRNIGSFANLLQRRYGNQFDESAQEYMNFILNGAKRMNDLLVGLLNLSSLTNETVGNNENVNLIEVVDIVKNNLKTSIEEKNAKVEFKGLIKNIPMNQLHTIQLMQNLIGNALKFVEKAPIITVYSVEQEDSYEIQVHDNGIGMDKAYENKVFRLFQRLDKTKNYEGNGVGLSICKNIVEKYGGKIWFESELNEGTQFFIQIPKSRMLLAA
jgi:signal transduction histidine kinase